MSTKSRQSESFMGKVLQHGLMLVFVVAVLSLGAFVYFVPDELTNSGQLMVAGMVMSLVKFSIAVCAIWFILRAMDASARVLFYEAYDRIEENPIAIAIYFGSRIVAFCLLASNLFQ